MPTSDIELLSRSYIVSVVSTGPHQFTMLSATHRFVVTAEFDKKGFGPVLHVSATPLDQRPQPSVAPVVDLTQYRSKHTSDDK